jgi:hypothetical protein
VVRTRGAGKAERNKKHSLIQGWALHGNLLRADPVTQKGATPLGGSIPSSCWRNARGSHLQVKDRMNFRGGKIASVDACFGAEHRDGALSKPICAIQIVSKPMRVPLLQ